MAQSVVSLLAFVIASSINDLYFDKLLKKSPSKKNIVWP